MVSIKFNNYHNNNDKDNQKSKEIDIDNCKITNYDPSTKTPSGAGDMTLEVQNGNVEYKRGQSIFNEDVKLNEKKYSVFTKIASMDKNGSNLTQQDLANARKDFDKNKNVWLTLGVTEFRYDPNAGIATIKFGEKELLRIDFVTEKEKEVKTEKIDNGVKTVSTSAETAGTSKSKQASGIQTVKNTAAKSKVQATTPNNEVDKIIATFSGGNIDIKDVKDMATVAKYTGISEEYIKEILVGIEGDKNYPLLRAEYDGVAGKGHPKGYLTVGFGHTSLIGVPNPTEEMKISEKQAYQILANDIITARKHAINTLRNISGRDLFNEAPPSIQNALIDLSFNKGPGELKNASLVANLEKGYYGAASRRTWYDTNVPGLQKRNLYRFLESIKDISKKEKPIAIQKFYDDHSSQLQVIFRKDNDARVAWNNACVKYNAKSYVC